MRAHPISGLPGAMVVVGVVVAAVAAVAIPARATNGARLTADEPQYLLSALSLWEDGSLTIGDELDAERYRDFHEGRLPVQTQPLDDGREVSPHDPLLPLVLAVPMGIGGWAAAKAMLAVLAGVLAALLVWTAVRRFGVPVGVAALVVAAFGVTPPLVAYGSQVYPELPAALAVTIAIAALTGPLRAGGVAALVGAVVALPWLGVKYAPVAIALATVGAWTLWRRGDRRVLLGAAGALVVAGLAYLAAHRLLYAGWTVYAAGDHFVGGEHTVIGGDPDYLGRTRRVWGLLIDRDFGLAAWAPAWLLLVPALVALSRRRPRGSAALVVPLAAGWGTATWIALTMHGWWWPGRQVVVVLPAAVLAVAWWVAHAGRVAVRALAAAGAIGALLWAWLLVEVLSRDRTLVVDFASTRNPIARVWHAVLPDYRLVSATTWWLQALAFTAIGALALWGWRGASDGAPAVAEIEPVIPRTRSSSNVPV